MIGAVVGIDPGNQFGLAIVTIAAEPKLLYHFTDKLTLKRSRLPTDYLNEAIARTFDTAQLAAAVIEDQYLPRGEKANVDTAIKIGRSGGRWEEACKVQEIPVEYLKPATWQHRQLKGLIRSVHAKSAQRKAAAQMFAKMAWRQVLGPDSADAACMARVVATRIHFERVRVPR